MLTNPQLLSLSNRKTKKPELNFTLVSAFFACLAFIYFWFNGYEYDQLFKMFKKYLVDIIVLFISLFFSSILFTYYILKRALRFNAGFLGILFKKRDLEEKYKFKYALDLLSKLEHSTYGIKSPIKLEMYRSIMGFEIGVIYSYVRFVYSSLFPTLKNIRSGRLLEFENLFYEISLEIFSVQSEHLYNLTYLTPEGKQKKIRKFIIDEYREEKKDLQANFFSKLILQVEESSSPYESLLVFINLWESYINDHVLLTKKWLEFHNGRYEGNLTFAAFVSQSFKEFPNCSVGIEAEYGLGVVSWKRTNDILEHSRVGKTVIDVMIEHDVIDRWIFDCRQLGLIGKTVLSYWTQDWLNELRSSNLKIRSIAIVYPEDSSSKRLLIDRFTQVLHKYSNVNRFVSMEQALIWSITGSKPN